MGALEEILQRHPVWRGGALVQGAPALPSGFAALDAELPGGGWPCQGLSEILADEPGIGELTLLMPAFARLTSAGKRALWISPPHIPYAPAVAAGGVDLANLLLVQPPGRREVLWAAEQALRAGSCHGLAVWLPKIRYAELQRLALAAQASRAVAFIFRPLAARAESSPACLRLVLEPAGAALTVHILKRRGSLLAAPLSLPLARPFHVLGRTALSWPAGDDARAARRLGLPVHA